MLQSSRRPAVQTDATSGLKCGDRSRARLQGVLMDINSSGVDCVILMLFKRLPYIWAHPFPRVRSRSKSFRFSRLAALVFVSMDVIIVEPHTGSSVHYCRMRACSGEGKIAANPAIDVPMSYSCPAFTPGTALNLIGRSADCDTDEAGGPETINTVSRS